jgi:uncharacterized protein (TIGR02996 family)
MTNEEGFLAAIAAEPTHDTPRLVYADWLEEHGDTRAAYLRLATQAAARLREGLKLEDLWHRLVSASQVAPVEWRVRAGPWFNVVLEAVQAQHKIGVIKTIRGLLHCGLKEVVPLVEFAPSVILRHLLLDEAQGAREKLENAYGVFPEPLRSGPACQVTLLITGSA